MRIALADANSPISESELVLFERNHGFLLPSSYRLFLLANNGGQPVPSRFPILGMPGNPFGRIQAFFGISAKIPTEDLGLVLADLARTIPSEILPIACTEGDDFVCIDRRRAPQRVVFWDRKPFWGNNIWSESQLYPIASDFDSFLAALC